MRRFAAAHLSESSPKGSLESGVTRRDSAPTAGGPGAERPDSPVPRLRLGLSHPADPLLNPADLGEGLGSFHLLCLVDQVAVHRACSLTGECLYPQLMTKARAATSDESRILGAFARSAGARDGLERLRSPPAACRRGGTGAVPGCLWLAPLASSCS